MIFVREVPSVLGIELLMEQYEEICVLLWLYELYSLIKIKIVQVMVKNIGVTGIF